MFEPSTIKQCVFVGLGAGISCFMITSDIGVEDAESSDDVYLHNSLPSKTRLPLMSSGTQGKSDPPPSMAESNSDLSVNGRWRPIFALANDYIRDSERY